MTDFELKVDGSKYSGWTSLSLTMSLEELAHSYTVNLTDRWNPGLTIFGTSKGEPVPIKAGDTCVIAVNGEKISTGYVDEDVLSYGPKTRSLRFSGRSKTADLIDCAAVYAKGQWRNKGLRNIANDLCEPFGISVKAAANLGPQFRRFSIQDSETAFQCLERAARMRGLLLLTDENGDLVFSRAGTTKTTTVLELGKNIIRGNKVNSWRERFSTYTVKAQAAGTDQASGSNVSALKRSSTDEHITRYRPTIIMAENEDSVLELEDRANWERNIRAGRGKRISYTVQGWDHADGVWKPNLLVKVKDNDARVEDELLLVSVTLSRGKEGTLAALELTYPEAFDVQPLPSPKIRTDAF